MYHLSAACYEHRPIFQEPDDLTYLEEEILVSLAEKNIPCHAWSFLPDHYHVLIEPDDLDEVGEMLRLIHSSIATEMNGKDNARGRQVWYRFSDRGIRNSDHYWSAIHYIHYNPVKDDHVDEIADWPWSSFDYFCKEFGEEKLRRIRKAHPIDEYEEGWDGE